MKACTIVVNNLDDGRFLPGLLASIRAQDCDDFDVLGADAGSTDDSLDVFRRHGISVLDCRGLNQAATVNRAVRSTATPFFAWINPDDRYAPWFVRSHLRTFDGAAVVDSPVVIAGHDGSARVHVPRGVDASVEDGQNYVFHPTTMIRRASWDNVGGFDETFRYAFDFEFWVRCRLRGGGFGRVPMPTAEWTSRPDSSTGTKGPAIRAEIRRVQEMHGLPTDRRYLP